MRPLQIFWLVHVFSTPHYTSSTEIRLQGIETTLHAVPDKRSGGNAVMSKLTSSCGAWNADGTVLGVSHPRCVEMLISFMLKATAGAALGRNVATAAQNPGGVQQWSYNQRLIRREDLLSENILDSVNAALTSRSLPIRAIHVDKSRDALDRNHDVYLNVYNDDANLRVRTNGSYSIATFSRDLPRMERDSSPLSLQTNGIYFSFYQVQGLKVQAYSNGSLTEQYVSDLDAFAKGLVANGLDSNDSWDFNACDQSKRSRLYGVIIAELDSINHAWEDFDIPTCIAANATGQMALSAHVSTYAQ